MFTVKIPIDVISKIINKHDPLGLIAIGAPLDEYNIEARIIFDTLNQNRFEDLIEPGELEMTIRKIFSEKFGASIVNRSLSKYKEISNQLMEALANAKVMEGPIKSDTSH